MKYKCIIFDLDGTIYFGNKLADKANEVIRKIRSSVEHVFFVTNNSAKSRKQVWQKLVGLGIEVKFEEVINSSFAIAKYLTENEFKKVYCIGTEALKSEILVNGIDVKSKTPEAVVVGYNPDFALNDINDILNVSLGDYKLIVANKERSYPTANGVIMPGAGPIVSAVECALNKKTDVLIGKPNSTMLEVMVSGLNLKPQEICVIGDSLESDIKMAKNYGADSILITNKDYTDCKTIKKLEELLEIL